MLVKSVLVKSCVFNRNGRSYPPEVLIDIKKQFETMNHPVFGTLGNGDNGMTNVGAISHKINKVFLQYERLSRKKKKQLKKRGLYKNWRNSNRSLIGEIEILDTPSGKLVKPFINNMVVRPSGSGKINKNGVIENYQLHSFNLINKEDDSFNGIIK